MHFGYGEGFIQLPSDSQRLLTSKKIKKKKKIKNQFSCFRG